MNQIFLLLFLFLLLPYLVVPILIRRNQYFSLIPNIRPVISGFLPNSVETCFEKTNETLRGLGFEHRIDAISLDFGPNLRVFMRLYVKSAQSIMAISTALLPDGEKNPVRNFIEFTSKLSDGREISTHNNDLSGVPIEHRQKISVALPFLDDVNTLFLLHVSTIKKYGQKLLPLPMMGSEFEFLVQSFKDDLLRQENLGCLTFDKENNCLRPTWAGAFLIGWYSMWPISLIRRLWQRIRAKSQIKSLNNVNA